MTEPVPVRPWMVTLLALLELACLAAAHALTHRKHTR